ncbi:MFS transporter [Novosphingobium sp. Gsoil 351]|uniref:MFS transporter n=1 Tax=Novosphingobium sp. Gsoil 351 TaxID=2675225 RepID=UPI0012B49232|nr:MFS transporter [Novosphingobium sp. Gsoil 351]QGN55704.1 MFS transporter [Novosphingobium sp. Gsoil 351]
MLKAIIAGSAGNLIEWYDFYVYAFTAIYFSKAFFPEGDRTAQLIGTAGIFAVGFLLRPLGGWYFGRLADRHGRRVSLVRSVLLMGLGSFMIAVLPTYAQAGSAAPALLLLGRMIQGFSTGGQYGATATYMAEIAVGSRRGYYASFQYVTLIGGQLAALMVILLLQTMLSEVEMAAYGWRVAFLLGAGGALLILSLRHLLVESSGGTEGSAGGSLIELVRHWRAVLIVLGLTAGGSLTFYTFSTYMQKYLVNTAQIAPSTANWIMTAALVPFIAFQPALGALSDRIGRRTNLIIFGLLATLLTVPLMKAAGAATSPTTAFALIVCGMFISSFYTSVSGLFKAELFPIHIRALGVGLTYGIGNGIFGGTAEFVALQFKAYGHETWFFWYVSAIAFATLLTALVMRKKSEI